MATVKFLYRSTREIGSITLRLLFRHSSKDYVIESKTRITIPKSEWKLLGQPKRIKDADLKNKKIELDKLLMDLESVVLKEFSNTNPSIINKKWLTDLLEEYYSPQTTKDIPVTVIDYFPIYLESIKNQVSATTLRRYGTSQTFLQKYIEDTGESPRIDEVDPDFLMSFEDFAYDQDYAINTVTKYFSVIKSLCKHALVYNNIPISSKFELIKLKTFKAPIVYLTLEEIKTINSIDEKELGDRLTKVRDWLVISCFTGQRISDFMRFNAKAIREDHGTKVIDIVQKKGNKSVTIPLFDPVVKVLDKYNGEFPPTISDQKFNEYVKEVVKIAGLDEVIEGGVVNLGEDGRKRKVFGKFPKHDLVSSHIGRRSFATNFYGKLRTPMIMNITGHSKESTFLGYIGKTSKDTATETAREYKKLKINV